MNGIRPQTPALTQDELVRYYGVCMRARMGGHRHVDVTYGENDEYVIKYQRSPNSPQVMLASEMVCESKLDSVQIPLEGFWLTSSVDEKDWKLLNPEACKGLESFYTGNPKQGMDKLLLGDGLRISVSISGEMVFVSGKTGARRTVHRFSRAVASRTLMRQFETEAIPKLIKDHAATVSSDMNNIISAYALKR